MGKGSIYILLMVLTLHNWSMSPTILTDNSEMLNDHVYTNTPESSIDISVSVLAICNHYPVCITRKLSKSFDKGLVHKCISYRDTVKKI